MLRTVYDVSCVLFGTLFLFTVDVLNDILGLVPVVLDASRSRDTMHVPYRPCNWMICNKIPLIYFNPLAAYLFFFISHSFHSRLIRLVQLCHFLQLLRFLLIIFLMCNLYLRKNTEHKSSGRDFKPWVPSQRC